MKNFSRLVFSLLSSVSALSATAANLDDPVLTRGEEVYRMSCATSYCHGVGGAAAGAPRLAARDFDAMFIANITANGVPETPMVGFANALAAEDMHAVLSYVASLNGIFDPQFSSNDPLASLGIEVADPRRIPLEGDPQLGRELFFDAYDKGVNRCSSCHEVEGIGIPVAAPMQNIPRSVNALRSVETPAVQTAVLAGESMPALLLSRRVAGSKFYDLSAVLPVLRTVAPGAELNFQDSAVWDHEAVMHAYTDEELELVVEFLQAISE